MRTLLALLVLSLSAPAYAQCGPDGMDSVCGPGRQNSIPAPVFLFAAPSASDPASLTASTGQTATCTGGFPGSLMADGGLLAYSVNGHCRVDYRGVVSEEARHNWIAQPLALNNAAWTHQHSPSITADACTFIDGTATADLVVSGGSDDFSATYQAFSSPDAGPWTLSGWPSGSDAGPSLDMERSGGTAFSSCACSVDAPYLCYGSGGTDCYAQFNKAVGPSPARLSVTTADSSNLTSLLGIVTPGQYGAASNAPGASSCWGGIQLEYGQFATTFIPDGGSRAADVIDWGAVTLSTTPSFSAAVQLEGLPVVGTAMVADLTDGTHSWTIAVNPAGTVTCSYGVNTDTSSATVTPGMVESVACSYNGTAIQTSVHGVTHSTAASFTPATSFTHLYMGSDGTTNQLNGFVSAACASKISTQCTSSSAPSVPASGLVYWFDADDVDGSNNSTMFTGASVSTWVNLGSGESGTGNTAPMFISNFVYGHPAVNLSGSTQMIDMGAGSESTAAFLHQTAVFDIVIALQGVRYTASNPLLDTDENGSLGTGLDISVDSSGHPIARIASSGTAVVNYTATHTALPLFSWGIIEVTGDGSSISISTDMQKFESAPITGALPAGISTDHLFIGGWNSTAGWDGSIEGALIYNRQLTAAERLGLKQLLAQRAGL